MTMNEMEILLREITDMLDSLYKQLDEVSEQMLILSLKNDLKGLKKIKDKLDEIFD